jgi:hypothetical protein
MSNLHNERYDEIKSLLKKSRFIFEQSPMTSDTESEPDTQINLAKDVESRISQDNQEYETAKDSDEKSSPSDKVKKYRISGGILALHGKNKIDLDITTDDKLAFQETMDEFIDEVSDLVDFNTLNVYPNNVEWSGHLIDEDINFTFTIGEDSGIYIDGTMIKVDEQFDNLIHKLQQFYQKFKSKWSKIIAGRKKTSETNAQD